MANLVSTDAQKLVDLDFQHIGVSFNPNNVVEHLPRTINQLVQLIGNNIVLKGLNVTAKVIDNSIYATIYPGILIQDLTLLEIKDRYEVVFKNANYYDIEGHFVVHTDYQFFEEGRQSSLKFGITFVDKFGIAEGGWYHTHNSIVLDVLQFEKDESGNLSTVRTNAWSGTSKIGIIHNVVVKSQPEKATGKLDLIQSEINYTARNPGEQGNNISIRHIVEPYIQVVTVNVETIDNRPTILISIPENGATTEEVVQAIRSNTYANALVTVTTNTDAEMGSGEIYLSGGTDGGEILPGEEEPMMQVVDNRGYDVIVYEEIEDPNDDEFEYEECSRFIEIHSVEYHKDGYQLENISLVKYICYVAQCYCNITGGTAPENYQWWLNGTTCPCNIDGDLGQYYIDTDHGDVYLKTEYTLPEDSLLDPFVILRLHSCEFYGRRSFEDYSIYTHPVTNHGVLDLEAIKEDPEQEIPDDLEYGEVVHKDSGWKFPPTSFYFDKYAYLQVPSHRMFNFGCTEFTIQFWVNFSSFDLEQTIISRRENTSSSYWKVSYIYQGTWGDELQFVHQNEGTSDVYGVVAPFTFELDTWYHVQFVGYCVPSLKQNNIIVRINGITQASSVYGYLDQFFGPINIGVLEQDYPLPFHGYLEDIIIAKRALKTSDFPNELPGPPFCSGYANLNWDWGNPDSIDRDETIELRVVHGKEPYVWEITHGDDYVLEEDLTTGRTNMLTAGPDSCGYVEVKVTDYLGDVVRKTIRNTHGVWVFKGWKCAMPAPQTFPEEKIGQFPWPTSLTTACYGGYRPNRYIITVWDYKEGHRRQVQKASCGGDWSNTFDRSQFENSEDFQAQYPSGYTWNEDECFGDIVDPLNCISAKCQRGTQGVSRGYFHYHKGINNDKNIYYEWECDYTFPHWNYDRNPYYVTAGSSAVVHIIGTAEPYDWEIVSGNGMLRKVQTVEPYNTIDIPAGSSNGIIKIRVNDAGQNWFEAELEIVDTLPIIFDWDNTDIIEPGQTITLSFKNGNGPFTWSITGTGFSLQDTTREDRMNLVTADSTVNGAAEITVADFDGLIQTFTIRSTVGKWEYVGPGNPIGKKVGEFVPKDDIPAVIYDQNGMVKVKDVGKYRVYQRSRSNVSGGFFGDYDDEIRQECEYDITEENSSITDPSIYTGALDWDYAPRNFMIWEPFLSRTFESIDLSWNYSCYSHYLIYYEWVEE